MAKTVHDDVLDAALNYIKTNCDKMTELSSQPGSFAAANTGALVLASVTMDSGDFSALANGTVSGRKMTVAAQTTTVSAAGTGAVIALLDTVNSKLLYTTDDSAGQALILNNPLNIAAWDIEFRDPA